MGKKFVMSSATIKSTFMRLLYNVYNIIIIASPYVHMGDDVLGPVSTFMYVKFRLLGRHSL